MVLQMEQPQNVALIKSDVKLLVAPQGHAKTCTLVAMMIDDALKNIKALRPPPYEGVEDIIAEPLTEDDIEFDRRMVQGNYKITKYVKGTDIEYDIDVVKIYLPDREPRIIRIPEDHIIVPNINLYYNMTLFGVEYEKVSVAEMIERLDDNTMTNGWLGIDQAEIEASARDSMTGLARTLMKEGSQFRKAGLHVVFIYTSFSEVDKLLKEKRDDFISCEMDYKTNKVTVWSLKRGEEKRDVHSFYAPSYFRFYDTNERRKLLPEQVRKAVWQSS